MVTRLFFLVFILLSFCKAERPSELELPAFVSEVQNEAEFEALGSAPLTGKYNEVVSVKVVYDLKTKKMYYINSKDFTFHYEFCQRYIDSEIYLSKFNYENYAEQSKDRRFLLGNINYFNHLNVYALELSPSDYMPVNMIEQLMNEIKNSSFFDSSLKLMLSTQRLIDVKGKFNPQIPLLTPEDIYKNLKSQSVVEGEGIGRLRFIEDFEKESPTFLPTDIIVIKETPLVLPRVAGVIVAEFQTPLSHLSILGKNRRIPVVAIKDVYENMSIVALKDKNVQLNVLQTTYTINESTRTPKGPKSIKNKTRLKFDLDVKGIIPLEDMDRQSSEFIGNKASNFGWLSRLSEKGEFKVPEAAFAIPFVYYAEHVAKCPAGKLIQHLIDNPKTYTDPAKLQIHLKEIRKAIEKQPLDYYFSKDVEEEVMSNSKYQRLRFRSSTNAEDANGFSGAGLYVSKTGIFDEPEKSIDDAIKKVWASLWSYAAYMEREYFGIDQSTVFMGILVHRSFPAEEVNGVIISKNLYRKHYPGFVVNAQVGDESVVKPKKGVTCDQFICYPHTSTNIQPDETVIDVITHSSLNEGKPVMTDEEVQLLANEVDKIKLHIYRRIGRRYTYEDFGLDIEFKLDAVTRQLYIKQFRVYND